MDWSPSQNIKMSLPVLPPWWSPPSRYLRCVLATFWHQNAQTGMVGDSDWARRDHHAEQRRQFKWQSVGRYFNPDRFDKLGVWLGVRFTHYATVGMMAGAIEMLAAGIVLMCASLLSGEN